MRLIAAMGFDRLAMLIVLWSTKQEKWGIRREPDAPWVLFSLYFWL
jgi:hypothetical protein